MDSDDLRAAITRYAAVSLALARVAAGMTLASAVRATAGQCILDHHGRTKKLSRRSLYRWIAAFKEGGLAALADTPRTSSAPTQVLSAAFVDFLVTEKGADINASLPQIIKRAGERGIIKKGEVSRSAVWRCALKLNLPLFADRGFGKKDKRRFAYPHRMMMVITDGKHFKAGVKHKKRVSMTFLDDSSRFGLAGVVGFTETDTLFLRGLWNTIEKWGLMSIVFVDNGSGFISKDSMLVCAKLKIALIHGTPAYPEGHGKIEKYHQRLFSELLCGFDGAADVDPRTAALEHRLVHYVTETYNREEHDSLGGDTPEKRFLEDPLPLRPGDLVELRKLFVLTKTRRVSRDHVVKVKGKPYETPAGYAGKIIKIFHHVLDGTVQMLHEQALIRLAPPDLALNALSRRAVSPEGETEPSRVPPKPSGMLAYAKDFAPVVGADGGFKEQE